MLQKLRKKEFDATILGWVSDWKGDPYQIWHGSQADLPESSNSGGYKNPEVDKLIDQLRITMNEQDQIKIYHELHRLIFEDQPYTFLYLDNGMMGVDSRVQNLKFYSLLRPHMDAREWYSSSPRLFGKERSAGVWRTNAQQYCRSPD
jgi:peptide/nickel transport system substrate-binding protein